MRPIVILLAAAACSARAPVIPPTQPTVPTTQPARLVEPEEAQMFREGSAGVTDERLRTILGTHWQDRLRLSPTWATSLGYHLWDDRLGDGSEAAHTAAMEDLREWLTVSQAIPTDSLSDADLLTRDLFAIDIETALATEACRWRHWSVQPRSNRMVSINGMPEDLEVTSAKSASDLLSRYQAAPATVDQAIENLRVGLGDGLVANAHSVGLVVEMIDTQLAKPDQEWPLSSPLETNENPEWTDDEIEAWRVEMRQAIGDGIRPALVRYRAF